MKNIKAFCIFLLLTASSCVSSCRGYQEYECFDNRTCYEGLKCVHMTTDPSRAIRVEYVCMPIDWQADPVKGDAGPK